MAACLTRPSVAAEITTLAGTGASGYSGDGGKSQLAAVGGPFGLAVGPDGALYVCEIANHVIRRIDSTTQKISTVAGSGRAGYAGDGGSATKALLNEPYEILFDADGHMFFVEMKNNLVRRVDRTTNVISTVAGNGKAGFSGDGGPATSSTLKSPHSISLDSERHLDICDIGNHRIRRVDLASGIIRTLSGTGERKPTPEGALLAGTPLNGPRALAFDGKSNLYLALREGNAVYRIDLKTNTLHHVAGSGEKGFSGDGGNARQAKLSGPKGITVGPDGNVYLADTENHAIRIIRISDGTIDTLIGDGIRGDGPDGQPRSCRLAQPHGIHVDARGNIYVGDSSNHRVRVLPRN